MCMHEICCVANESLEYEKHPGIFSFPYFFQLPSPWLAHPTTYQIVALSLPSHRSATLPSPHVTGALALINHETCARMSVRSWRTTCVRRSTLSPAPTPSSLNDSNCPTVRTLPLQTALKLPTAWGLASLWASPSTNVSMAFQTLSL